MENIEIELFDDYLKEVKVPLITVFNNPIDFPGKYVARLFDLDKPTKYVVIRDTYEEVMISIPPSMTKLNKQKEDHISVLEVWI